MFCNETQLLLITAVWEDETTLWLPAVLLQIVMHVWMFHVTAYRVSKVKNAYGFVQRYSTSVASIISLINSDFHIVFYYKQALCQVSILNW